MPRMDYLVLELISMDYQIDHDWWKDLFDDIYLLTDARSVCDEGLTREEVNFLEETTAPRELEKLKMIRSNPFAVRERGAGRPTKRERRDLNKLKDSDFWE